MKEGGGKGGDLHTFRITVLLVDDQAMIAEAVRRALIEEDLDFHYCQDPTAAVKMALELKPTIILQDLVMPEIDGLTMVKFYRANPALAQVPIIVLSTKEDPEIKGKAFEFGANDYLVKLPDKVELIARIRYHSRAYIAQMERDEAFRALEKSRMELAEANEILEKLSSLDGLTGVANRRRFDEIINQEWQRSVRHSTSISLIMIDIDYFKLYNDTYGHQGGDECLIRVAKALERAARRETDTVARYGGEEFGVILPETGANGAFAVAEALRVAIEAENIAHASSQVCDHVTISVGVATWLPEKGSRQDHLIAITDAALYKSKENGRNMVTSAGVKSD
ncbi:MAG: diguanylate cyclase [Proteobacteria bacterium]|nr:diguanylate cyclase [Pseudomonadota bacterium]MBU1689007.1 diguanylate cyclase [Pseudomonadota bacterium]